MKKQAGIAWQLKLPDGKVARGFIRQANPTVAARVLELMRDFYSTEILKAKVQTTKRRYE